MDVQHKEIQAMKEIVDQCVGIPLFTYEMQLNADRPHGEYAAIRCLSSLNPGFDECKYITDEEGNEIFRTRGVRILTFQIIFSRDGQEYIDFDNSFYRHDVQAKLAEHKFAAMAKEQLNLATTQFETNWEVRKAVRMQFNVLREQLSKTGGLMEDAYVDGKFIDGDQVILTKGK